MLIGLAGFGLVGYLVKAAHNSGRMMIEPSIVTAAFVPIAALAIWWTVRRIRKKNIAGEDQPNPRHPSPLPGVDASRHSASGSRFQNIS